MIIDMIKNLIPFFVSYCFFILFFGVMFITTEVEIDGEIKTDNGGQESSLGYYGLVMLGVLRNSVGKLGFFRYDEIVKRNKICMRTHINLIWIVYFISIIFLFTMGLNFMVGVIDNTYKKLEKLKDANLHRNKAALNLECIYILQWFGTVKNIDSLVFSKCIGRQQEELLIMHGDEEEETNRLIKMINKEFHKNDVVLKAQAKL